MKKRVTLLIENEWCFPWDPTAQKGWGLSATIESVEDVSDLDAYLGLIQRERHCRPAEAMLRDEIMRLRALQP